MGLTDYSRMDKEFFESGVRAERERIIKLLEELKGDQEGCCDECKPHLESSRNYLTAVIALIKGESQKDNETVVVLIEGEK